MIGELISAGANIIGGLLGRSAQEDANEVAERNAQRNIDWQKTFAQNGITWKVADAKAAGIHPLYAMGASTPSFSPVTVGVTPETGLAEGFSKAGQDIGRAFQATRNQGERTDAVSEASTKLALEEQGLRNDLLRSQIASINARLTAPQVGPPMATPSDNFLVPGQTQSGLIKPDPLKVAPAAADRPYQEGGAIPDIGHSNTGTGWAPYPSKDLKERIEDVMPYEWEHFWRNRVMPSFGQSLRGPFPAPPGKEWWWNTLKQEYQLHPKGQRPWMGHRVPN